MSLNDVLAAHSSALTKGGGRPGISSLNNVRGALGRPYHGYHRRIERKAAALLHGLATSHGFTDGNKRTAWVATTILIEASGYSLVTQPDERVDDIVVNIVEGIMSEDELVRWFRERIVRT